MMSFELCRDMTTRIWKENNFGRIETRGNKKITWKWQDFILSSYDSKTKQGALALLGLEKSFSTVVPTLEFGNSRDMASAGLGDMTSKTILETAEIWPLLVLGNSRDKASAGLG